jgi:alpha-mannosidase
MKKRTLIVFILACFLFPGTARPEPEPARLTAHLIGHAHIDLGWLWRWEETVREIAVHTFRGTLDVMNAMKGLTFAQSQAALYEAIERQNPEMFAEIKAKVKAGTWAPVGGMWVEPDLNMPDGESLVRQLFYGQRYFRARFGVGTSVGWNPDSFGHNAQLPQILRKAGIDSYVFGRCAPENTPIFWWEGLDGSRVLAYVPPGWYNLSLRDGIKEPLAQAAACTPARDFLLLYGEGDHGGGPRSTDLEAYGRYRKDPDQPRLEFDTPEGYFKRLTSQRLEFPVVKGELNTTFPACYTTQARAKKNNRRAESLLLTAEKFSALANTGRFRDYYPELDLDEAWKIVLRNQFHDILDGSSIGPVYDESAPAYEEAFARARRALDFSLESIAADVDTRGEGRAIIVFNPLFWDRTSEVEAALDLPAAMTDGTDLILRDPQGRDVSCQVLSRSAAGDRTLIRLLFVAEAVPSFGYRVYHVLPGRPAPAPAGAPSASRTSLENEFLRVSLDPATGWMTSLYDKRLGREMLSGPGNVLEAITDTPKSMSAWQLGLKDRIARLGESGARVEVVESGPVRAAVRVTSTFGSSTFSQEIRLYRGIPRADCRLRFDWQERQVMIKAAFPTVAKNSQATFEIPYGAVSRPADGREVPALRWIDLTDESGQFGLSLLNDCKYGFDVKDGTLRLSVIHGATAPDPEADRGPNELLYALYPHPGSWQEGGSVRRGYELNAPLEVRTVMSHGGLWPAEASFGQCSGGEGVIVSAVKKESGYYNRALVLRVYEAFGRPAEAEVRLPWPVKGRETDLLEGELGSEPVRGETLKFSLGPAEIKTFRLTKMKD